MDNTWKCIQVAFRSNSNLVNTYQTYLAMIARNCHRVYTPLDLLMDPAESMTRYHLYRSLVYNQVRKGGFSLVLFLFHVDLYVFQLLLSEFAIALII